MKTSNSSTTATKAVYADLRNDFMFKKAFSQKDIMIPFLNDILETDKIQDIVYRNVEQLGFDAESAKVYYDIYCHCAGGKDFIVEMQCSPQKYYRERMIFYSTYPLQHQYVEAKAEYEKLPEPKRPFRFTYKLYPVYIISITEFALEHEADWPEDSFVSRYSIRENSTGELYCGTLNYVFIELPRFRRALQQKSVGAEKWAYVFNNITKLREVPGELSEKYFRKLFESAKIANFTGEEQLSYIESEKMKYDYENCIEYAEEKGLAKGREEGEAKGKAEGLAEGEAKGEANKARSVAANMLGKGLSTDLIAECTGLSEEEIKALKTN